MITCEEFFAEFTDYLGESSLARGSSRTRIASVPVPHVPGPVRFQPQDCEDRDRK
jgi:hypothetical protein